MSLMMYALQIWSICSCAFARISITSCPIVVPICSRSTFMSSKTSQSVLMRTGSVNSQTQGTHLAQHGPGASNRPWQSSGVYAGCSTTLAALMIHTMTMAHCTTCPTCRHSRQKPAASILTGLISALGTMTKVSRNIYAIKTIFLLINNQVGEALFCKWRARTGHRLQAAILLRHKVTKMYTRVSQILVAHHTTSGPIVSLLLQ